MDNIYLVGSSGGNTRVVKCNNSGDIEWSDTWNGGVGWAIAIDSNDDIFIAGYSFVSNPTYNYQFLLIKYTSDGDFQWYQNWGDEKDDLLESIAIDDNDNIYMAGLVDDDNGGGKMILFKRNDTGVISWSKTWNGAGGERANAISLDSLDNVYIGGWSEQYGSRRWVILKYSSEGSFQWSIFKTGHSECRDIFGDSSDGIYATGFAGGDFTLAKYSPFGLEELSFTWGSESFDTSFSGAVDSWNNIYLTGATEGFGASETDNCLVRFSLDSDGDGLTDQDEMTVYFTDPNNADSDGDEVSDGEEVLTHGTDPLNDDTDLDGMTDGWEIRYSLDPLVNDMMLDPDQDSLTNIQEFFLGTDPTDPDTDSDGITDGDEVINNTDPLDPNDPPPDEIINSYSVMVITVVIFLSTFVLIRNRRKRVI